MSLFEDAVEFVLRHEGGYSNDAADPGGETNFGISKLAHPDVDIKALTRTGAIDIYRTDYWERCNAAQLPGQVALVVFDAGVNQGLGWAKRMLQREVSVEADGIIGPETLTAIQKKRQEVLARDLLVRRALHYTETLGWQNFGKGWLTRLFDLHALMLQY